MTLGAVPGDRAWVRTTGGSWTTGPWKHCGYALWTRQMVRELIRREFGVKMSASAVGRMLHRLGLSPQRPLWGAWQADPEKVAAWKDTE